MLRTGPCIIHHPHRTSKLDASKRGNEHVKDCGSINMYSRMAVEISETNAKTVRASLTEGCRHTPTPTRLSTPPFRCAALRCELTGLDFCPPSSWRASEQQDHPPNVVPCRNLMFLLFLNSCDSILASETLICLFPLN